jgi:8-oxo-dGTP pyrophosphatase MutT (NUDIX family)
MERFCLSCGSSEIEEIIERDSGRVLYRCKNCGKRSGRVLERDEKAVEKHLEDGRVMHVSIGAVIARGNKYLLIDRRRYPFCYAIIAGHLHRDETPEMGIIREVKEEVNLAVKKLKLIFHGVIEGDKCRRGVDVHEWYLFECECDGEPSKSSEASEAKKVEWVAKEELKGINLCSTIEYLFKKACIL